MSQMVLIKIPNSLGLFKPPNALQRIGTSIRSGLLEGTIDSELDKAESADKTANQPSNLALVLRELRRKNQEATQAKEDRL